MFLDKDKIKLSADNLKKFKQIEKEVLSGIPIQYVLGKCSFHDREFTANDSVLIPRPETEKIIEIATRFIESRITNYLPAAASRQRMQAGELRINTGFNILDIGTGSGNIIISIIKDCSGNPIIHNSKFVIQPFASDISPKALQIAKQNARFHNVENKIKFLKSDLFSNPKLPKKFDLIIANLPYLSPEETKKLPFEPALALNGGKDGLELIAKLIENLPEKLSKNGQAILEIGYKQKNSIIKMATKKNLKTKVLKDLGGYDRYAIFSIDK